MQPVARRESGPHSLCPIFSGRVWHNPKGLSVILGKRASPAFPGVPARPPPRWSGMRLSAGTSCSRKVKVIRTRPLYSSSSSSSGCRAHSLHSGLHGNTSYLQIHTCHISLCEGAGLYFP